MASHRKKRRTELLRDAASHGPYLWSDLDVENALLWFQCYSSSPPSSSSSSSSFGGGERRRGDPSRRRLGTDDGLGVEDVEEENDKNTMILNYDKNSNVEKEEPNELIIKRKYKKGVENVEEHENFEEEKDVKK